MVVFWVFEVRFYLWSPSVLSTSCLVKTLDKDPDPIGGFQNRPAPAPHLGFDWILLDADVEAS